MSIDSSITEVDSRDDEAATLDAAVRQINNSFPMGAIPGIVGLPATIQRIREFGSLPAGWKPKARRISQKACACAERVLLQAANDLAQRGLSLPAPLASPVRQGGVALQWTVGGRSVLITTLSNSITYERREQPGPVVSGKVTLEDAAGLIVWLAGAEP
jgi:hypothetical protein